MIKLIAAVDVNFGISKNGQIPWNFPEDLKFFREKTVGNVVVMGRNTFFSLARCPLEGRINCVLSRTLVSAAGAEVFRSPEDIIEKYSDFWVIGGAQLYNHVLENDLVDYALITHVGGDHDADRFIDPRPLKKFFRRVIQESDGYSVIEYERSSR